MNYKISSQEDAKHTLLNRRNGGSLQKNQYMKALLLNYPRTPELTNNSLILSVTQSRLLPQLKVHLIGSLNTNSKILMLKYQQVQFK